MNKEFWNERFGSSDYVYSEEPNPFIKRYVDLFVGQQKLLFPAEGEGRNAVYAAQQGHAVHAFDMSEKAMEKCGRLAENKNVEINYQLGAFEEMQYEDESFDGIGLGYFHLPPEVRIRYYRKIQEWLKPGGALFFIFFHKEQFGLTSGGPQRLDMLYDETQLISDFSTIDFTELKKESLILDEGPYHQGPAVVLYGFGRKS